MSVLASLPVSAMIGPPSRLSRGDAEVAVEVSTGKRDVDFKGTVGTSIIAPARLHMSQSSVALRGSYAVANNFSPYIFFGGSAANLGSLNLASGGVSQGTLGLRGDNGFLWGAGFHFNFWPIASAPDLALGFSGEYRRYSSDIAGGNIDINEFRLALKASHTFDKLTTYGGGVYSNLSGRFKGVTTGGVTPGGAQAGGSIDSLKNYGLFVGANYQFTEKISGQLEGELLSSTAINGSLIYNFGAPLIRLPRRQPPPPPVKAAEVTMYAGEREASERVAEEQSVRVVVAPPVPARRVKPSERPAASASPIPSAAPQATAPEVSAAQRRLERQATEERNARTAEESVKLGNDFTALGRYDEAIIHYKRAVVSDPDNQRAWYNLATAQYLNRDYSSAKTSFEMSIRINPRDAESHLFLGFSYYKMGMIEPAVRAWNRVLELDPTNAVALNNLQALGR